MRNLIVKRCFYAGWLVFAGIGTSVGDEPVQLAAPVDSYSVMPISRSVDSSLLPPAPESGEFLPPLDWEEAMSEDGLHPYAERVEYDPCVPDDPEALHCRLFESAVEVLTAPHEPLAKTFEFLLQSEHHTLHTELDDEAIGMQDVVDRPRLVYEVGEDFLGPGSLDFGIESPTGEIVRPALWVFGTYRAGYNYINRPSTNVSEFAQRLDLFSQLNLSGTERVVFGVRPFDEEKGPKRVWTLYDFEDGRWRDGYNADIQTLFFEGDFGEIFPWLDPWDTQALDYGFSIGRQPLSLQRGLLINESRLDAVTVTRNTLYGNGILNLRISGMYAWNQINRNNQIPDHNSNHHSGELFGLFFEADRDVATNRLDIVGVNSVRKDLGDLAAFGFSDIRRIHGARYTYNSSAHVLASFATSGYETAASGNGVLLFHQLSWTPHHSDDLIYVTSFYAIDQFTSAARDPLVGGPLGQTGILFASAGLGNFGAALNNQASDAAGGSLGYQMFFEETRQQVIWEIAGRANTKSMTATNRPQIATGLAWQKALGQHWVLAAVGFAQKTVGMNLLSGGRLELMTQF